MFKCLKIGTNDPAPTELRQTLKKKQNRVDYIEKCRGILKKKIQQYSNRNCYDTELIKDQTSSKCN